jgi:hypothetical protein
MSTTMPSSGARRQSTSSMVATGVTGFAGVMLMTVGLLQVLAGFAAVLEDDVYVTGVAYTYELDLATWGWTHLVIGVVAAAIGVAVIAGSVIGRLVGIFLAVLGILSNFAFLPQSPTWSLVMIVFYVLVIWALFHQIAEDEDAAL